MYVHIGAMLAPQWDKPINRDKPIYRPPKHLTGKNWWGFGACIFGLEHITTGYFWVNRLLKSNSLASFVRFGGPGDSTDGLWSIRWWFQMLGDFHSYLAWRIFLKPPTSDGLCLFFCFPIYIPSKKIRSSTISEKKNWSLPKANIATWKIGRCPAPQKKFPNHQFSPLLC